MAALTESVGILKGILIRQMTTGIYKEATKGFVHKVNERANVRQELSRITGENFTESFEDKMAASITFSHLLADLKN